MIILLSILLFFYLIVLGFFYLKQESLIFFPKETSYSYEYDFSNKFKEIFFETPNNGKIHALRFFVDKPKGIVLYLHGNAGNLEDWALVNKMFVERNYDVLIIDYRTYGKSKGILTEKNLHNDVQHIYNKVKEEFSEDMIIVYGRSLGTGMATKLCANNLPKAMILESPYYSISTIAKRIAPFLPINLLLKYKFESNKYIIEVKSPIYILHGKQDEVIPFESGKQLFNLVKDRAKFIEIENGTHSNLSSFEEYSYFLDEVLQKE